MTRQGRQTVRIAASAALLLSLTGGARAGDGAAVEPLGFSADGRIFAFEQYGTEGVSGSDYAQIALVDVATGRFVDGAPVAVETGDLDASPKQDSAPDPLARVRREVGKRAAPLLKRLAIDRPGVRAGFVAASRPRDTTLQIASESNGQQSPAVAALRESAAATMALDPAIFGPGAHLDLREFAVHAPIRSCEDNGYAAKGFVVTLERAGSPPQRLGASAPPRPNDPCPLGFGLAEAQALPLAHGGVALAALVQRFEYVMEGADRRFSVVTGQVR